jgi:hypothetical protein
MPRGKAKYIRCEGDGGDLFLINEVSRLVNLSQKRIREYEKEGFIKPLREKNTNNRLYSNFDVSQINQINSLIHDRGFTLACLRNLMVLAPCWNIFDCDKKEACPAFQLPWRPCYEVREYRGTLCEGPCSRCAVYLNRAVKREKILEKYTLEP